MGGRIALLGWGSLLWQGGNAFDGWHEPWRCDGCYLKIEFSRVSATRCGALTLVIDPKVGVSVRVAWCPSRRKNVDETIEDLRCREGTNKKNIGVFSAIGNSRCRDEESLAVIEHWTKAQALDAVVWTDLRSNFIQKIGEPFSVDAAMRYLDSLEGKAKRMAEEYIQRAPAFVHTPLREAFNRRLGML